MMARRVRERIVRMATAGGCFIGASLSCADMLVYLYGDVLKVSPDNLKDPDRDFLLLSKGHAVPALYAALVEHGFLDAERLESHLTTRDSIYWHPNASIPGVEFHSGSLGHSLPVGVGVAIEARLRQSERRVFVILGDGELNEGSIWEAFLIAGARRLSNLVAVIDRNHFQANLPTEELIPLYPLAAKFEAFGWSVRQVDGHSYDDLESGFAQIPDGDGKPIAIVCDTVRGKGVPSLEGRADRWFADFSATEVDALLEELRVEIRQQETSELTYLM